MRVAAVEPAEIDEHALGFRLGPRINAAGRLRRADPALELLLTEDDERAGAVAEELDALNRERRDEELRIMIEAEHACLPQLDRAALVVAGEGWHPGVVGIVASRLVECHRRPCVAIALDGDSGRGSGRSISAYDLHAGLDACAAHLTRFGGHRMAAGLELAAESVAPFAAALAAHAGAALAPEDLMREERVDALVPGGELGLPLAEELGRLAPFGIGNPRPALLVPAARVKMATAMGEDKDHARFTLENGGALARGVAFRTSAAALAKLGGEPHDLAVTLEANFWNGTVEPRVILRALAPTRPGDCPVLGEDEPFWALVERELEAPLDDVATPGPPARELRDRRGEGFAGVAGDLLSSGDPVLVVTADSARRREAVGGLLGGFAEGRLALVSWEVLLHDPSLAAGWPHVLALDPLPVPRAEAVFSALPDGGWAHLVQGQDETDFALAATRAGLALRPALAAAYRALRDADPTPDALAGALRGDLRYPAHSAGLRPGVACAHRAGPRGVLAARRRRAGLAPARGKAHRRRAFRRVPGIRRAARAWPRDASAAGWPLPPDARAVTSCSVSPRMRKVRPYWSPAAPATSGASSSSGCSSGVPGAGARPAPLGRGAAARRSRIASSLSWPMCGTCPPRRSRTWTPCSTSPASRTTRLPSTTPRGTGR